MKPLFFKPIFIVALIVLSGCDTKKTMGVQEQLDSLNALAAEAYHNRDYAAALIPMQEAAILSRREFGLNDTQSLSNLTHLALIYVLIGQFEEAEAIYQNELNINRRVLGENHPKTLISLNNLGLIYMSLRRFEKAEPLFKKALRTNLKDDIHRITTLNNLAYQYLLQGRFRDAEPLYEKAQNIHRAGLERGDPDTVVDTDQMTWVVSFIGDDNAGGIAVDCSMFSGNVGPFNPDPETGGMMAQCGPFGTMPTYGMWGGWNGTGGSGGGNGVPPPPPSGGGGDGDAPVLTDDEKKKIPDDMVDDFNGCSNLPESNRDGCCGRTTVNCKSNCDLDSDEWLACRLGCDKAGKICKSGKEL